MFALSARAANDDVRFGMITEGTSDHLRELRAIAGQGQVRHACKSMLALTLAAHAACGMRWGAFPAVQCPAAYFSLEDEAAIVMYRLRRIVEAYELPAQNVIDGLRIFDGTQTDPTLAVEVSELGIRKLIPTVGMDRIEQAVQDAGLIVIDNASDAFSGNENERRQVRGFIRMLAKMAQDHDAGVLLLSHIDKNAAKFGDGGNAYSGSTAWNNSVRSRLALQRDETGIVLVHQKSNFTREADPTILFAADHGVLVAQDARAAAATADLQAGKDADAVLQAVKVAIRAGATVSTAQAGPSTAWHTLRDYPELPDEFRTKEGRPRVSAALAKLVRDGRLFRATFKKADRHPGERFELPQNISERGSTGAAAESPTPPMRTPAPQVLAGEPLPAGVPHSRTTPALPQPCPRCDNEGCEWCRP